MTTASLPGLINAHSHAFQRAVRGVAEEPANFWSWREAMYRAANRFNPDELYAIARMAYLEMALAGIATVGEFHYLHRDPEGHSYADPNELSLAMVRAANDVGLRICLLRVAYLRPGFDRAADPLQRRFIEPLDEFLRNTESLSKQLDRTMAWAGVAPHSVRAVPLEALRQIAAFSQQRSLPLHMHVAEQPRELEECRAEYGATPVELLHREALLHSRFTAVHGIHVSAAEVAQLAAARCFVCACPTTERNLGDGIVPAHDMLESGVRICLGSDSQAQIHILEDARELEYHLRLQSRVRGSIPPATLFHCATASGSESLQVPGNEDSFEIDLDHPSIAGIADLKSAAVFALDPEAIRGVVVNGRRIVSDRRHRDQGAIVEAFQRTMKKSNAR